MKCSFRLIPNELNGGDSCLLNYQGSDEPKNVFGKKCTIRVFEIDSQAEGKKNDLLAEFSTVIVKAPLPDRGQFDSAQTTRTDSFDNALPGPEYKNDPKGNLLPIPLKYTPAHFKLNLFGCKEQTYVILIRGDKSEVDECVFEIGFSIHIEGNEVFNSFKGHATLDCGNLLTQNLRNFADFIKSNHDDLIFTRGFGTHFGNKFKYNYPTEDACLQDYSLIQFRRIDNSWIDSNRGKWLKSEKADYDNSVGKFGVQKTSCIEYVESVLENGFKLTGMAGDWEQIWNYFKTKDGIGQHLAKILVDCGWVALYYNPDVINPFDKNQEHCDTYKEIQSHGTYGTKNGKINIPPSIPIHDCIVNYCPTRIFEDGTFPTKITTTESIKITQLVSLPFAFLMSKWSIHTAMLISGKVYEVHWDGGPKTNHLFSNSRSFVFNGDETKSWEWLHGLVIVPPNQFK